MSLTSEAHFYDYWPPDFGWGGRNDPESHPGMLVPFHHSGVNFGQVHKYAASVFTALLDELVPHIEGGLHAGSCWGFSTTDNLPDGTRSFHSFGLAIDVNWNVNQMGTNIPDAHGRYAIPRAVATALARKYGLEWGGNWSGGYHDDMHFEVHLTPAAARSVKPSKPSVTPAPSPSSSDLLEWIMSLSGAPKGLTYNQFLDDLARRVWSADVIPAPTDPATGKPDPKNPTWGAASFLHWTYAAATAIARKVGA